MMYRGDEYVADTVAKVKLEMVRFRTKRENNVDLHNLTLKHCERFDQINRESLLAPQTCLRI